MKREEHWEGIYRSKPEHRLSWYAPRLDRSLAMIRAVAEPGAEIIDVGGGASTLVDDLLELGYVNISVLDLSKTALSIARTRLEDRAGAVQWIPADVLSAELPVAWYDVWHDRAVFHFLTDTADRRIYAEVARSSIKRGGRLIVAAFAPQGPSRCSGLDVVRYTAETLAAELGPGFVLEQEVRETHVTPGAAEQSFIYCSFRKP